MNNRDMNAFIRRQAGRAPVVPVAPVEPKPANANAGAGTDKPPVVLTANDIMNALIRRASGQSVGVRRLP